MIASLMIERVLVTRGVQILYDEIYHPGVNIIHGSNGSGKSSIADFIFFGLGGDLREWKESASRAESVYIQITTASGILTLRRDISIEAARPMLIFFGPIGEGLASPGTGWQYLPYRRPERGYSFSQVLFRAIGLPESISDGSSNITMHQILRLLYVDQLTPVQRIFRIENFDTWQTRQAIGDLLLGLGGYDLFEKQIALRKTEQDYKEATAVFRNLVSIASGYGESILHEHISGAIATLNQNRTELLSNVSSLTKAVENPEDQTRLKTLRSQNLKEYNNARRAVSKLFEEIVTLEYEITDAEGFLRHLRQSLEDFDEAALTFSVLGHLTFEFCPSCFARVDAKEPDHCHLCNAKRVESEEDSRTLAVRLDLEMQLRESQELQIDREADLSQKRASLRVAKQTLRRVTSTIEVESTSDITGREIAIADLSRKIGFIDSQLEVLQKRLELSKRIDAASIAKDELNSLITKLKIDIASIQDAQTNRKFQTKTLISSQTKSILQKDLDEHSDFGDIRNVSFSFAEDWVAINGDPNRAGSASGMVVLKNSFALGLLTSSLIDQYFTLPRWMLFDNVEDKGMVEERSWNFQRIIVQKSSEAKLPHQIIFTTSKIAPELDRPNFVVGKRYTRGERSLRDIVQERPES